jgi:hypothetical protein
METQIGSVGGDESIELQRVVKIVGKMVINNVDENCMHIHVIPFAPSFMIHLIHPVTIW